MLITALAASPSDAADPDAIVVRPIASTATTWTGQPIVLPHLAPRVTVSIYEIKPGAILPEHKHPFPRYGYLLSGALRITDTQSGQSKDFGPGDFIAESVDEWHQGTGIGSEPVKLLVIDLTEGDQSNGIVKK